MGGQGGAERVGIDRPLRVILGVAMTMLFHETVEELEELARRAQVAERVFQRVVTDRLFDELTQPRPLAVGRGARGADGARAKPVAGEVVEGRTGPTQGLD